MPPPDTVRLRHMLEAADDALSFTHGRSRADLETDRQLVLALLKCLEMIGEAASRVSEETRIAHPDIPWQQIIGMRNRLIHVYYDVDLDLVWTTIDQDLPSLRDRLNATLAV